MSKKTDNAYNTPWRKSATAIYKKANDGRIYGTYEVEMDAVLDQGQRRQHYRKIPEEELYKQRNITYDFYIYSRELLHEPVA